MTRPDSSAEYVRLSLVLTTVGRPARFSRFLDGLEVALEALDTDTVVELILVDQDPTRACTALLTERNLPLACRLLTSGPGAAAGRATGTAVARGEILAIPNDNCWYRCDTLSRVVDAFSSSDAPDVLSGRLLTADGRPSALRWAAERGPLTRSNWMRRSIATTMFFRLTPVLQVGSFNSAIGTGSAGRAQAGEETDLLLRMLAAGYRANYDPEITVCYDDPRDLPTPESVIKMRGYGFGQGVLWRNYRLSRSLMAWLAGRKVVAAGLHGLRGNPILARADLAFVQGWVAGYWSRDSGSSAGNRDGVS